MFKIFQEFLTVFHIEKEKYCTAANLMMVVFLVGGAAVVGVSEMKRLAIKTNMLWITLITVTPTA